MRIGLFYGGAALPWDVLGQVEQIVRAEAEGPSSCRTRSATTRTDHSRGRARS